MDTQTESHDQINLRINDLLAVAEPSSNTNGADTHERIDHLLRTVKL